MIVRKKILWLSGKNLIVVQKTTLWLSEKSLIVVRKKTLWLSEKNITVYEIQTTIRLKIETWMIVLWMIVS